MIEPKEEKKHRITFKTSNDFVEDLMEAIEGSKGFTSENPLVFALDLEENGESSWNCGLDAKSLLRIKDIRRIYDR